MYDFERELLSIKDSADSLKSFIDSLKKNIKQLEKQLEEKDDINWHVDGFKVTKTILKYIAQGIEEKKAIFMSYDDFSDRLSYRSVEAIWKTSRASKSGLLLYGRHYTAKKMKEAGFKPAEISIVLGVSITTVNKLLKTGCVCD